MFTKGSRVIISRPIKAWGDYLKGKTGKLITVSKTQRHATMVLDGDPLTEEMWVAIRELDLL